MDSLDQLAVTIQSSDKIEVQSWKLANSGDLVADYCTGTT
jgi:hypothetical protein